MSRTVCPNCDIVRIAGDFCGQKTVIEFQVVVMSQVGVENVPHLFYANCMTLKGIQIKGRGAVSNDVGRFETHTRMDVDDGWETDAELKMLRTEVALERPRKMITYNRSPDLPFDRSINPYRGCEHGCVYCFARPTHAYLGLSPGLDFETRLVARPQAADVLRTELAKKTYAVAPIAIGTNTDPYQPIEIKHEITRACLKVLADTGHPVAIVTKGLSLIHI